MLERASQSGKRKPKVTASTGVGLGSSPQGCQPFPKQRAIPQLCWTKSLRPQRSSSQMMQGWGVIPGRREKGREAQGWAKAGFPGMRRGFPSLCCRQSRTEFLGTHGITGRPAVKTYSVSCYKEVMDATLSLCLSWTEKKRNSPPGRQDDLPCPAQRKAWTQWTPKSFRVHRLVLYSHQAGYAGRSCVVFGFHHKIKGYK